MPNKLLILVIEESAQDFERLKSYIEAVEEYDATIQWKNTYKSGYDYFMNQPIDICFLDCKMGEFTGADFLKELKHHKEEVPIILIGNNVGEEIEKIYEDDGANDFIYRQELSLDIVTHSLRYGFENHQRLLELRAHEEKYSKLFYNSLEAVFTTNENFCIIEANDSFKSLVGLTDISNFDLQTLFFVEDLPSLFNEKREQADRKVLRTKIRNSQGEELDIFLSITPILNDENGVYYQGIIHDITDLEKAQSKAVEADNLKLIGRMARIIGHEVRNPLTNIVLATEEIRQDLDDNDDAILMLEMIQRNSNRISDLIDNFLKHTRNTELKKVPVQIGNVIQSAIDNCHDRILLFGIDFRTKRIEQDLEVSIDADKIIIALTNILINAVEVLEKVDNPSLEVSLDVNSTKIEITIQDNGPGMTEEVEKQLFNPFYSSKQGGLGLGMTNTKHIIGLHQGEIQLETELGKGTTFKIVLPIA